ncbi:MAG: hypothetical protein IPM97_04625 [Bdellovibrionaceae bacterium]|nr:hypothetical protein [Pseudobdellovibrionaceae bacterium]
MNRNIDKLSSECATFAMEMRERRKRLKIVCYPDIKNVCKGIVPGDSRIFNCLTEKRKNISDRCQAEMREIRLFGAY